MSRVCIFLANGFEEVEALTPADLLRRAGVAVTLVSMEETLTVTGRSNISVLCDALWADADPENADILVLPGGQPGTRNLEAHEGLAVLLEKFYADGRKIAAICAAPTVFGHRGYLRGRQATCYPGLEGELAGAVLVPGAKVLTDGHVTTSRGVGTAIPFGLRLIELLCGKEKADQVATGIVFSEA